MDAATRRSFESRFGHDFGGVRIHTDDVAARSAHAVDARAYTVGNDIVFGRHFYSPASTEGRGLLAHELTHVLQQRGAARQSGPLTMGDPNAAYEREADAASQRVMSGRTGGRVGEASVTSVARSMLMRAPLFSSTVDVCRHQLTSRPFKVTDGRLSVTINARWQASDEYEGTDPVRCGRETYRVTLVQSGVVFDNEYGTRDYPTGVPYTRTWEGLTPGTYRLVVWTNNTNPNCCLSGTIDVAEGDTTAAQAAPADAPKVCGPDVTPWLMDQMETNASSAVVADMREKNDSDMLPYDTVALATWAWLVRTGGEWDFKKDLGVMLGNRTSCRRNCLGRLYSVTIDGQCMTFEAPANIHFGYVGRAAGFSEAFLLWGASTAQVAEARGETQDDPRDVQAIRKGVALFEAGSARGLTKAGLEANYFERLPEGDGDPAGCAPCTTRL